MAMAAGAPSGEDADFETTAHDINLSRKRPIDERSADERPTDKGPADERQADEGLADE
jgi:hypothetical protein